MKHRKFDWRSITPRLIFRFLLVWVLIFLMGLMLEVMLYDKIYRNVVSRALTKVEDEVVELYEQEKYYEIKMFRLHISND